MNDLLGNRPPHIHIKLRSGPDAVYAKAWIERPGDRHPPTMLTIETTRREAIASVLAWARGWGKRETSFQEMGREP